MAPPVPLSSIGGNFQPPPTPHMGQNKLTIRRTIGLIVFGVLIVLIVGIFAAVAALQWWVATISALAVPVVIAVGMVAAAIVGYQNFNTQIRDLRTQLRLAHKEIGKLEETIRRLQASSRKTRLTRQGGGRATRKMESTYSTQTNGRHLPE